MKQKEIARNRKISRYPSGNNGTPQGEQWKVVLRGLGVLLGRSEGVLEHSLGLLGRSRAVSGGS